jgi:sulfatase modifying factor 1
MKFGVPLFLFSLVLVCCSTKQVSQKVADQSLPKNYIREVMVADVEPPCPTDMTQVEGEYCPNLEEVCLKYLDKPLCLKQNDKGLCLKMSSPMRCEEFKFPTVCRSNTKHVNFCIDIYEYPNKEGEKPKLQVSWYQAKETCESLGKRLCSDIEWTQACRGPRNLPYPYGYKRDSTVCRIDLPWQDPNTHTFEQLDKTVPAGSMINCVSEYGAYDMTGNGDEWAVSDSSKSYSEAPYISILKGGHPHGVRNRCTPNTDGHGPTFTFYDTGFRCCKDTQ